MRRTVSHREYLRKHLAGPARAAAYLNAVAQDGDMKSLLKALRNVVRAQGGVGQLARKTKLSRTSLYRTLSSAGNPEISTLGAILAVYGLRVGFSPIAHASLYRRAARGGAGAARYLAD
ncbi:MAG: transcriptional regulator [Elusimicrobia bacterium]|nr:transcriptional regulator [Elusimicrobiota bacterium]